MDSFLKALDGKKTYLLAIAGAVVYGLVLAGLMTQEQANPILGLLGFGAAASIRSAVK
jgi:hypothetical protein